MNWFLVALVISSWNGEVMSLKKMAEFKTEIECQSALDKMQKMPWGASKNMECITGAIEIKERK